MDGLRPQCWCSWPAGAKRQSPKRDLGTLGTLLVAGIRLLLGGAAVKHVYIHSKLGPVTAKQHLDCSVPAVCGCV